jgi:6-phosphogluconolactonase
MATIRVLPDGEHLTLAAAEHVVKLASEAIAANGRFTIALAGGSTPAPVYEKLAGDEFSARVDWSRVQVFWGDERCVPPDDPQSNYRMARLALLDRVPIPSGNIHRIRGEDEPEEAAALYARELQTVLGGDAERGGPPAAGFDLILLGMGEDGHTASLFPGSRAVTEQKRWVMAQYLEVVAAWRVTLTPVVINAAENIAFIVAGANKAERVREVLQGPSQPTVLPSQAIKPTRGRLVWLMDSAAASQLKDV